MAEKTARNDIMGNKESRAAQTAASPYSQEKINSTVTKACARIAPTWPLDQFIAVNPFWGFRDIPASKVASFLKARAGSNLLMPREWYQRAWRRGEFGTRHLHQAVAETLPEDGELHATLRALEVSLRDENKNTNGGGAPTGLLLTDVVDTDRNLFKNLSWREFVTNSLSQACATYFDTYQASVSMGDASSAPTRTGAKLYQAWLTMAKEDRNPEILMDLKSYREHIHALPTTAYRLIEEAVTQLELGPDELEGYFVALLQNMLGWASWCAYHQFQASLQNEGDVHLKELLAMRLAWELLLLRTSGRSTLHRWRLAMVGWSRSEFLAHDNQRVDWFCQRAMEFAYQERLSRQLEFAMGNKGLTAKSTGYQPVTPAGISSPPQTRGAFGPKKASSPDVQAVFCIDVRSEVFRRALEKSGKEADTRVQTRGFAGFFGLPAAYQPLGSQSARPQLPGLLSPSLRIEDTGHSHLHKIDHLKAKRAARASSATMWKKVKTAPISSFSFVESLGPFYLFKLIGDSLGWTQSRSAAEAKGCKAKTAHKTKPRLTSTMEGKELSQNELTDLAAGVLKSMGLNKDFARLVVFIGHGSETTNNPHAAGYDCGACCGQSGQANARALADLLNNKLIRRSLLTKGIEVPETTHFVAGLHNTTTDEVRLYDVDETPGTHRSDMHVFEKRLEEAGQRARRERAPSLGLSDISDKKLKKLFSKRTRSWSELRPEWGLAGNASFIVAPRELTRGIDLEGRAFLHDYSFQDDDGLSVLEGIMMGPLVVTNWINMQYYASTVDNRRFGSGNKTLHNVVGGRIGVFEGNGGDLRIGLPSQALHDGEKMMHTPLRLSAFIAAPRDALDVMIRKHAVLRNLLDCDWMYLLSMEKENQAIYRYQKGAWVPADEN